jgi:hypothetical protein
MSCCPSCGPGHCNTHGSFCVQPPGRAGPTCDALAGEWLADNGSLFRLTPLLARRHRLPPNTDHIHCRIRSDTVASLKGFLGVWTNAWANSSGRRRRAAPFGCPGCLRGAEHHRSCCSGRGSCIGGWCACQRGAFGVDCAHDEQQPRAGPSAPTPHRSLAIYVYELPPALGAFTFGRMATGNYAAEAHFFDALLGDSSVRTLEPSRADLFAVPFYAVYG